MKTKTPLSLTERKHYRGVTLTMTVSVFLLLSLYIFVFAPLYVSFANDILYMDSILPEIFSVLTTLVDVLVFGIVYGTILYAIYRFTLRRSIPLIRIYVGAILYKNGGNLLMTYLTDGIPTDYLFDLLNILFLILLEAFLGAIVILIGAVILYRADAREKIRLEAAVLARKEYTPLAEYFPFRKMISLRNTLQRASFWMAFAVMLSMILQRISYDIMMPITGYQDILWMVLYYAMDIVCFGVIVYFAMILLEIHYHEKDPSVRIAEDTGSIISR